jgi:hypothetical protein
MRVGGGKEEETMKSGVAGIVAGVAFIVLLATLVHLELRVGSQNADVAAVRNELAAQRRDRAGSAMDAPRASPAMPAAVRAPIDSDTIAAIASAVVQLQAQQAAAGAAKGVEVQPPRGLEQEKAIAGADNAVTAAIARGRLTRDDVLQVRASLASGSATPEEVDAIRSRIAVAINAQKLIPEDRFQTYP